MTARILPVGAFVCLLRESLELDPFYANLWLEGEIGDFSRSSAGHTYFSLRDDDGTLKCVLFRNQALRQHHPLRLGDHVSVHGGLSMYARSGSLQLVADLVRPAGFGAAWLEFEYLRQRLAAEGLFDPLRKRPLPQWPHTIGVVTSPHGAAWHDIQTVVRRRYPLATLVISPAQVQGDGAGESIVAALDALQQEPDIDAIIIARGGGGNDDLSAFNDERVVRAVFASAVPIVAGIGHATDRTLVEDTADASAPTPSAAAEICVPSVVEIAEHVRSIAARLTWTLASRRGEASESVTRATRRIRLRNPSLELHRRHSLIAGAKDRLAQMTRAQRGSHAQRLAARSEVLTALDPNAVLRRGYAVLRHKADDRPLFSITQVAEDDDVVVSIEGGSFEATVRQGTLSSASIR